MISKIINQLQIIKYLPILDILIVVRCQTQRMDSNTLVKWT